MKKKIFVSIISLSFLFAFFPSINVYAACPPNCDTGDITAGGDGDITAGGDGTGTAGGDTGSGDFSLDVTIDNPLATDIDTLPEFVEEVLRIVLKVGIPIVTLFIIYAGLLFVMAAGNPEKLKKAKETLLWTLVGAAVLLGAWVIAEAIQGTLVQLGA
ncbi:MAG: hypothetical protein KBD26_03685 [Candidatus Pacebacteria bacterium]|nr:hypothetical protein [Candidatus Paceibacterota bacterium]MBP9772905.1 hypothetical protein [Candidatus Paceibacterota bacterium]QQR76398.1 MAG: hypothetical protein IPJ63_02755 [Candidatus Nomurabacteria bacterium]